MNSLVVKKALRWLFQLSKQEQYCGPYTDKLVHALRYNYDLFMAAIHQQQSSSSERHRALLDMCEDMAKLARAWLSWLSVAGTGGSQLGALAQTIATSGTLTFQRGGFHSFQMYTNLLKEMSNQVPPGNARRCASTTKTTTTTAEPTTAAAACSGCSGHGLCDADGMCVCNGGWKGDDCERPPICVTTKCSHHGIMSPSGIGCRGFLCFLLAFLSVCSGVLCRLSNVLQVSATARESVFAAWATPAPPAMWCPCACPAAAPTTATATIRASACA